MRIPMSLAILMLASLRAAAGDSEREPPVSTVAQLDSTFIIPESGPLPADERA